MAGDRGPGGVGNLLCRGGLSFFYIFFGTEVPGELSRLRRTAWKSLAGSRERLEAPRVRGIRRGRQGGDGASGADIEEVQEETRRIDPQDDTVRSEQGTGRTGNRDDEALLQGEQGVAAE